MLSSAKKITSPTIRVKRRYKSIKPIPPFCPTIVGNFHALPSPTADPATANTKPILENLELNFDLILKFLNHLSRIYIYFFLKTVLINKILT